MNDRSQAEDGLLPLVQAAQVRLAIEQVRRIPLPHFLVDVCVAWTAYKAGVGPTAWAWFAGMTFAQVGRTLYLVRLERLHTLSAAQMLVRLATSLTILGALHAILMAMVFAHPVGSAHYVLTMILVGNAAGAVSPAAGHLRSYLAWAIAFGGTLALCWVTRGTLEGLAIALLVVALFVILTLYVRDQGVTQAELVRLTDSLRRERDRAERASQAKTRFFSAASHDLRQPLTALSYNAATVRALAVVSGNETLAKVGQGISRALDESRALLDSLLEVSQLDAGAVRVSWEAVDIVSLLREVADTCASVALERGLDLRLQCDVAEPIAAWADVALLRRVVQNLVGNALKFTQSGHVLLHCQCLRGSGAEEVEIRVTDTGPGIPYAAQEHVFEEFFQVDNAERDRSRGLGLGLAIVRRLVALLHGSITLHSVPGEGTTFRVLLQRTSAVSAFPAVGSAGEEGTSTLLAAGRRVMVVDDEREIRESVTTLLTTFGWVVCAAPDLACALASWKGGFVPDVLVIDFRLREGASGLDVLRELRGCGCAAPALMITGDTEPGRITAARAAGIPVMYKPVDGFKLARSLATLVEQGATTP